MGTKSEIPAKPGIIIQILNAKAKHGFIPTATFYNRVGVRRKRWAMLCRNEISPTLEELKSVGSYFEADIKEFI